MSIYDMPKPVDVRTGDKCYAFVWIGQKPTSCDACGTPYWEHTHEARPSRRFPNRLDHRLHAVISDKSREGCRRKWAPTP